MIKLPGLIDPHVHLRVPGGEHKEDWYSGTAAALAGGFTYVLAMPNTSPPLIDAEAVQATLAEAAADAVCDYGVYLGGTVENSETGKQLADSVAGLKLYLDDTFGTLRIDWRDLDVMNAHFANWPATSPLVCHAESRSVPAAMMLAQIHRRPVHIAHVSLQAEIECIRAAKAVGVPVTCEVAPHHLFLTQTDAPRLGRGRCEVRPRLATTADQAALWRAVEDGTVDCIATDHAPHLLSEKDGEQPPPGFPGLEIALSLMMGAVQAGQITLERLIELMYHNPRAIFGLPEQADTWVEFDEDEQWVVQAAHCHSKCGWTPFEGERLRGRVSRVVLRGQIVYENGQILALRGSGKHCRSEIV